MLLVYCWVSHHLISAGRCYSFTRSISIHALRWNKIRFHATSGNANDKNKGQQSDKLQYDANENAVDMNASPSIDGVEPRDKSNKTALYPVFRKRFHIP